MVVYGDQTDILRIGSIKTKEQLIKGIKMDVKGRMEGKEKFKLLANSSTLGSSWGFYCVIDC